MKAICIGQAAYDITLPMDHFPIENKKTRSQDKIECSGGSACNCAYLLAKWGIDTYFAGVVGDDCAVFRRAEIVCPCGRGIGAGNHVFFILFVKKTVIHW